jgi:osmoprotectant transport system permease protein
MSDPAGALELDPSVRPGPAAREPGRHRWRGLIVRPVFIAVMLLVLYLVVSNQTLDSVEQQNLNAHEISTQLWQHVKLSVVCTLLIVVIAVPLGILLTRPGARWARPIGLALGNLGQAVPSIGLVVLLAIWIGIGFRTAVIALVVYSVLPVLRNTIVGLEQVDPSTIEAARGMGLSKRAVLWKIEMPLSVPVILAGVRTALVLTVASAVLATFINGGGLGDGISTGLSLSRPVVTITYGLLVAALALLADWLGLIAEELLRPGGVCKTTK